MWKYVRLLRLEDQYLQFGAAIASGIYLNSRNISIFWWALATSCFSMCAFILNELTDRNDTDKYSWNGTHIKQADQFDMKVVHVMFFLLFCTGFLFSLYVGLFWWGMLLFTVGIMYSWKPIRLKARFGSDILAQILVWWALPFWAPIWQQSASTESIVFLLAMCFLIWAGFFPYQLADYQADLRAGLKNTHIILGVQKSIMLEISCAVIGVVLYGIFHLYTGALWSLTLLAFGIYAFIYYWRQGNCI